ncbi:hypothetical protein BamMC406_6180 [Burkholderia ambifaria MC40-6]|uniref:Uncharacterized protein n=1 Tax=Burkholderia ambifaria (strain MC40-6) TaxID=398577 RepID=B1Z4F1_BURA4|nr:hypothetical protein BamMC406_6180 [Burkholderia ambifaria MC40-6]
MNDGRIPDGRARSGSRAGTRCVPHAVLTLSAAGGYTVSVRAPVVAPYGADRLCHAFPEGGGRDGGGRH